MIRNQYLIKYKVPFNPDTWLEWKTFANTAKYATERFKRHCIKYHIKFEDMTVELL